MSAFYVPPVPNDQRKLLIVDDEVSNLELLEAILRPEGYQLTRAFTGKEALDICYSMTPDLVIMDVRMPEMNGFEACREIKALCSDRFIPVMLLTSLDDTNSKVHGLDSGADEYMVKQPSRAELLARVRALLRIRDLSYNLLVSKRQIQETNEKLTKAQKRLEEELELVGAIQRSFIPSHFPTHPEITFTHYYAPCTQAGGDYFDVIEIGKAHVGLLIADVTGHGTPAAVIMAITHTLMHSFISTFHYPSTALKVANEKLNEHLSPTFFITMFYGILNLDNLQFRFSSAGHEPMILFRHAENKIEYLRTKYGYPLKLQESDDYDECEISLEPMDKLILFTDGLIEIRNNDGELFTSTRLEALIRKYSHLTTQEFVDSIIHDIKEFRQDEVFDDDVTLFVIERKG